MHYAALEGYHGVGKVIAPKTIGIDIIIKGDTGCHLQVEIAAEGGEEPPAANAGDHGLFTAAVIYLGPVIFILAGNGVVGFQADHEIRVRGIVGSNADFGRIAEVIIIAVFRLVTVTYLGE